MASCAYHARNSCWVWIRPIRVWLARPIRLFSEQQTRLWSRLLDYCRIHGVQWISLEVRMSNVPAIRLYQSCGFKEVGRREKYYTDTGEDALVLQLELAHALKLPFSQKI
ncbi:GNAT family N-acetyltransferase [Desulfonatronospira sp. MSAO_Bac3]|uniref:GNAT family N-acetyltransferase n=1 Tax=Desulfonatronospira sp. MSAO_Bac3 TaxID=2293857 RepID=UPI000FF33DBD|nr:GNAT family N-acetyltransferase [Desulfonatronospira sp. MSAO_Bac3]RQD77385.1 MAG: GNAT family N-acetyltransferase [Desulfonatronospira sp. MSAO_Bac3]